MVSVEHLSMEFSSRPLLDDISFLINRRDRIALVGKNGAGKTTLLRLIAGEQRPTSGVISKQRDITIGYLPQTMIHATGTTIRDEAKKAFKNLSEIKTLIDKETAELEVRTDYQSNSYSELLEQLNHHQQLLGMLGSQTAEGELERTLLGLGFAQADLDRQCEEFSGGWRMRVELAKILLQQPDLLLLDEPTNHLDIESIQWLEQFIMQSKSAVLLVSHDRAFLDNVTNRTIEISLGHIYDY